jgi:hypothetical protein
LPIVSQCCMHRCRCLLATCHFNPTRLSGSGAGTVECIFLDDSISYHIIAPGTPIAQKLLVAVRCPRPPSNPCRVGPDTAQPYRYVDKSREVCITSHHVASRRDSVPHVGSFVTRRIIETGGNVPDAPPGEPKKRPELLLRWSDCERIVHDCRPPPRRTTAELMAAQREGFVGGICGLKIEEEREVAGEKGIYMYVERGGGGCVTWTMDDGRGRDQKDHSVEFLLLSLNHSLPTTTSYLAVHILNCSPSLSLSPSPLLTTRRRHDRPTHLPVRAPSPLHLRHRPRPHRPALRGVLLQGCLGPAQHSCPADEVCQEVQPLCDTTTHRRARRRTRGMEGQAPGLAEGQASQDSERSGSRGRHVQTPQVPARSHDGEHLRVGILGCTQRGMVLTSAATARGVPTRILSTRHSRIPDMRWVAAQCRNGGLLSSLTCSPHLCERSGHGMTRTSRRGAG